MSVVSVVIPIYKACPTENETKSFEQCLKILEKHPVSLVCPESLDISLYVSISSGFSKKIEINRFNDNYFSSIQSYCRLMLSLEFYKRFKEYEYILIYQLDAWVFRDELDLWCQKGYDFIGAPWFENNSSNSTNFLEFSGNGGFSLRKVESILKALKVFKLFKSPKELFGNEFDNSSFLRFCLRFPINLAKSFGFRNTINYHSSIYMSNEDAFWLKNAPNYFPDFRIARYYEAIPFSFECQPEKLYEMNDCKLPFGCHGWEKYDYVSFWKKYM